MIRKKIEFFFESKLHVHIKKVDGYFYNGLITSKIRPDVWMLDERKLGHTYLFLSEIEDVTEFRVEEKK